MQMLTIGDYLRQSILYSPDQTGGKQATNHSDNWPLGTSQETQLNLHLRYTKLENSRVAKGKTAAD